MTNNPYEPPEASIHVVSGLGSQGRVTVVFLYGEHDFASHQDVERSLGPLDGVVLVDLTACGFVDSSILAIFLAKDQSLKRAGGHLELIVPPSQLHLSRTLVRLGMHELIPVRATQADATP